MTTRHLPHNLEAEQAILGALLVDNRLYPRVVPILRAEMFAVPAHQTVWTWAVGLLAKGRLADPVTMMRLADADPAFDEVGGGKYLRSLYMAAETLLMADDYALLVADLWRKRQAILLGEELAELMANPETDADVAEAIAKVRDKLAKLMAGGDDRDDALGSILDGLEDELNSPELPLSTGFPELDRSMVGGLFPGRLYGILSTPKGFKTGVMQTIAANVSLAGCPVGWIDTELGQRLLIKRLAAMVGNFPDKLYAYQRHPEVLAAIERLRDVSRPDILIRTRTSITFDQLKVEMEDLVARHGRRGIVLDYWQRVGGHRGGDKVDHLTQVAAFLRDFALTHNVWVLTAAQIGRSGQAYFGEGLKQSCDWWGEIKMSDQELLRPDITPNGVKQLWIENPVNRWGKPHDIGDEKNPAFFIHPHGPRLAEVNGQGELY